MNNFYLDIISLTHLKIFENSLPPESPNWIERSVVPFEHFPNYICSFSRVMRPRYRILRLLPLYKHCDLQQVAMVTMCIDYQCHMNQRYITKICFVFIYIRHHIKFYLSCVCSCLFIVIILLMFFNMKICFRSNLFNNKVVFINYLIRNLINKYQCFFPLVFVYLRSQ